MDIVKVILSSLLSVVGIFIIAKIMGHKQLSQLDFFDYVSGITIGSIAAELATELEAPWKPLVALVLYGAVSVLFSCLTHKFPRTRKYINGSPSILMNGGKIYRENMKKAKLDLSEFMMLCREQGYFHLGDVQTAIFEHNGKLTILPTAESRPLTPKDLTLSPPEDAIETEIIMDGRVMGENLKRMGLDKSWLEHQLREQGYQSAREIFLGVCDRTHKLSLYARN